MVQIEKRIAELGLKLPPAPKPVATYVPYVKVGNLLFVSGQGPLINGKSYITGKLGREVSEEEGYKAAEIAALNCIAIVKEAVGDLDKVERRGSLPARRTSIGSLGSLTEPQICSLRSSEKRGSTQEAL